jgi:hypothetical protein
MKINITYTLIALIVFINFSCSSDDSSLNEKLSSFTEPFLGFCISDEELLNNINKPDNVTEQPESLYKFYQTQDGVEEVRYRITKNRYDDQYLYNNTNVEFYPGSQNFEFMMNWLANKYGEPKFTQVEVYLDTYYFNQSGEYDYNVVLNVSNDNADSDQLFLAYFTSCEY